MYRSPRFGRLVAGVLALGLSASAFAGFAATESFLPAVGRVPGKDGAEFYSTVWATNLTGAPVHFTFDFLEAGQANPNPANFTDTLAPGETKVYENVVETKLGLTNALGAARIVSDGEILVAERIYNQDPGAALGDTEGLFFAGVPKSFSISAGQSASIQGINQGGAEDFRYNFALVETAGGSPTVNVQVFDGAGALLGQRAFPLSPYEQIQPGVGDVVAGIHTTNARITATVTGGTGSVLLAGAQVANGSRDSSGFEMSFRDDILGSGGGTAGVTSLNGLTGALTIAHGANTTVNVNGKTITIDAISGSGTGLTAVAHDNSLAGSGTVSVPLGIANGQVVRSLNGLHDAVTLAAGSNVTLTPSGSTITIAATGGSGGGLTLPYAGTGTLGTPLFSVTNTDNVGIYGKSGGSGGVYGEGGAFGVYGQGTEGVHGQGTVLGVHGVSGAPNGTLTNAGVYGESHDYSGVTGVSSNSYGVNALSEGGTRIGVHGVSVASSGAILTGAGVYGESHDLFGVAGSSVNGSGVNGDSINGYGVRAHSSGNNGILGETSLAAAAGVQGGNNDTGTSGYLGGQNYGVFGISPSSNGIIGQTSFATAAGVQGQNTNTGTAGYLGGQNYGVFSHGDIKSDGGKSFVEPHPSDPSKEINYVCLEGRESGTYFRGSGHVVGGFATIDVPEDFRMVTSGKGLTVQITPIGEFATLVVKSYGLDRIVVQSNRDVEFFYMVNGVRKALEDHRPIAENLDFVPKSADDAAFGKGLPAESVRRLKANGSLNPDGTINLDTAHRMGWDRQESWKRAEAAKER